jgi:hypothetical protein
MPSTSELLTRLAGLMRSRRTTTFYLNGAPGSGKTHFLQTLAAQLPTQLANTQTLGPYSLSLREQWTRELHERVLFDLHEMGYLEAQPSVPDPDNWADLWLWIASNGHFKNGQSFAVLVDVSSDGFDDLDPLADLFSGGRRLEGAWQDQRLGVHTVYAGCWAERVLEEHYRTISISFPYSHGRNSSTWSGITVEELVHLVLARRSQEARPIHGQTLFELTGGHPGAALEILELIPSGSLGLSRLLSETETAAARGITAARLLAIWRRLPPESLCLVREMVLRGRLLATQSQYAVDALVAAALAQVRGEGNQAYIGFRSWFAELVVRYHLEELSIADQETKRVRVSELMPTIRAMNDEAYGLINDVENTARNFVVTYLSRTYQGNGSILAGRHLKPRQNTNDLADAHQRAVEWRTRNQKYGLPVDTNPLIAYCSTSDLAELIDEIAQEMHSDRWQKAARAMRGLTQIRDAVMHNQLIDDRCLAEIMSVQAQIHAALDSFVLPEKRAESGA